MKVLVLLAVVFSMMVPFASHAVLWDFNNAAQADDWEVIVGECGIDGSAYKLHNPTTEARALTGDPSWTDYTISCKARLTEAGTYRNIAIVWRVAEGHEYLLMLESGRKQAEWYKNPGTGYVSIQNDALEIDTENWFDFEVVVEGTTFEAYYNGELINTVEDSEVTVGRVGARIYGCTSHIDDFEITGPGIDTTAVKATGKLATTWGDLKK